ncbi:hypothetical protein AVEN_9150-1 [Araneus ventricosus]|uniref:Uncharacterized protein n=1 Tax=Araneus ventricosus TaxID=182803 RepID=A0A4Y2L659_ARAVE|nr:hypothetical protein AVEN_9150-1 [Araneus ventricosus]
MFPMFFPTAVALNGYIYAKGYDYDVVRTNCIIMVQVYDPSSDRWSFVSAPRLTKLEIITAIAYREHLYPICGEILCCSPGSIENYCPVKDVWIPMPDLPVPYLAPRAIVLNDVLIVHEADLGRIILDETSSPVSWNPENRNWHIIQESSPLHMIQLFKFCTITVLNVLKRIAKRNRQQSHNFVKSPLA